MMTFLNNKYTKWYYNIITNAKTQNRQKGLGIYYENHHIIPKCLGGVKSTLLTGLDKYLLQGFSQGRTL